MKKILAFDQSLSITGYAVFEDSNLAKFGAIDLHQEKDAWVRTQLMYLKIDHLIASVAPDVVIIEDVALRQSVKTLIMLARLQGSMMRAAWIRNIPVYLYPASTWRREVGIHQGKDTKRGELKQLAMELVRQSYGITVKNDVAEAICIGLCHLKREGVLPVEEHPLIHLPTNVVG